VIAVGIFSRIFTGYDSDGVSRESWKEALAAEARRQDSDRGPRGEDKRPADEGRERGEK